MVSLGIDFGTGYARAATLAGRTPVLIQDSDGTSAIPSVVCFDRGAVRVGRSAAARAAMYPDTAVRGVKWFMGRAPDDRALNDVPRDVAARLVRDQPARGLLLRVGDRELSPGNIAVHIFRYLAELCERRVGAPPDRVVVTVPPWLPAAGRQAIVLAAGEAGLGVERVIADAAAVALGLPPSRQATDQVAAIVDVGAGGVSASILRVRANEIAVLSSAGDAMAGGDDVDRVLVRRAVTELGSRLPGGAELGMAEMLRQIVETMKRDLSEAVEASVVLPFLPGSPALAIDRASLSSALGELLRRIEATWARALANASLGVRKIDTFYATGGMTQAPAVRACLERVLGRAPTPLYNASGSAFGAATLAGMLAGELPRVLVNDSLAMAAPARPSNAAAAAGPHGVRGAEIGGRTATVTPLRVPASTPKPVLGAPCEPTQPSMPIVARPTAQPSMPFVARPTTQPSMPIVARPTTQPSMPIVARPAAAPFAPSALGSARPAQASLHIFPPPAPRPISEEHAIRDPRAPMTTGRRISSEIAIPARSSTMAPPTSRPGDAGPQTARPSFLPGPGSGASRRPITGERASVRVPQAPAMPHALGAEFLHAAAGPGSSPRPSAPVSSIPPASAGAPSARSSGGAGGTASTGRPKSVTAEYFNAQLRHSQRPPGSGQPSIPPMSHPAAQRITGEIQASDHAPPTRREGSMPPPSRRSTGSRAIAPAFEIGSGTFVCPTDAASLLALPIARPLEPADLAPVALPVLLVRVLAREQARGVLTLARGDKTATIHLLDGRACLSKSEHSAATQAFTWKDGTYSFEAKAIATGARTTISMVRLTIDGLRVLCRSFTADEIDAALGPRFDLAPIMRPEAARIVGRFGLTGSEARLVETGFDGIATARALARSGIGRHTSGELLLLLTLFGAIAWAPAKVIAAERIEDEIEAHARKVLAGNHFEAFGVHWSATTETIEETHRALVARLAPASDWGRAAPEACAKMRDRIEAAYVVLRDPILRIAHRRSAYQVDFEAAADLLEKRAEALTLREEEREATSVRSDAREFVKTGMSGQGRAVSMEALIRATTKPPVPKSGE